MSPKVRLGKYQFNLPRSQIARMAIGVAFILGGIAGFLPVLGFWMVPVGLLVLSIDLPAVRRWRRQVTVWWGKRKQRESSGGAGTGRPSSQPPPGQG